MKPQKKERLIAQHRKGCFMINAIKNGTAVTAWSGLVDKDQPYYFGNYSANDKVIRGRHHVWLRVTCNDPNCKAIKAVHSSILRNP